MFGRTYHTDCQRSGAGSHLANWAKWAILAEPGTVMSIKPLPLPSSAPRNRRHKPVEVTALLALRPLSAGELKRVSRALAAEGLAEMRPTRIVLTPDDAKAVAAGDERAVPASILRDKAPRPAHAPSPDGALTETVPVPATAPQRAWRQSRARCPSAWPGRRCVGRCGEHRHRRLFLIGGPPSPPAGAQPADAGARACRHCMAPYLP
jgi:hypothetical protein